MKIRWTSFDEYMNYRKHSALQSPAIPASIVLAVVLGVVVTIVMYITGSQVR